MSSIMKRIPCSVHHSISKRVTRILEEANPRSFYLESYRYVRQVQRRRPFVLPGTKAELYDAPGDRFYIADEEDAASAVMNELTRAAEQDVSRHGSILMQDVLLHSQSADLSILSASQELSHIPCILSTSGAGEQLAGIALDLGAGNLPGSFWN